MQKRKYRLSLCIILCLFTLFMACCSVSTSAETVQKEAGQEGPAQKVPEQERSEQKKPKQEGTEQNGAEQNGPEQKETGQNGAEQNGPEQAVALGIFPGGIGGTEQEDTQDSGYDWRNADKARTRGTLSHDGYTLEQVVVLGRHGTRSPSSRSQEVLAEITPHEWFSWTSAPSELTPRGSALETKMGQYFRWWMEKESFFPENYRPEDGAVRIYANAKQRTIVTAQSFAEGLLPAADLAIETHVDYDSTDPVFKSQLTFANDAYIQDVEAQVAELYEDDITALEDNYSLLMDILDMEDSKAWQDGTVEAFRTDDTELIFKQNAEPDLSGSLKMAGRVSDALVMQYYEEPDDEKAAFGHVLTQAQWKMVSEVKDTYQEMLFASPLVAPNVAHPLLKEIRDELAVPGRKFTYLSGHDSNIGSVLASLDTEEYTLPDSVEKKVPIGCKLVFSRWSDANGETWISLDLVYQTADQLRGLTQIDTDTPPAIVPITLKGVEQNEDGLCASEDVMDCLEQAIGKYDLLKKKYGIEAD